VGARIEVVLKAMLTPDSTSVPGSGLLLQPSTAVESSGCNGVHHSQWLLRAGVNIRVSGLEESLHVVHLLLGDVLVSAFANTMTEVDRSDGNSGLNKHAGIGLSSRFSLVI